MTSEFAAKLDDSLLPSVAAEGKYREQMAAENIRRTIMFAKVVSVLVSFLIGIMIWQYQGSELFPFLLAEPYSRLFFSYLFCSVLLLFLCSRMANHEKLTFLYRICLLILCARQAALDLALYDSMVIFLLVLQSIAALVSMRVRNLLIFFPGSAVLFIIFAQQQIQSLTINHYLQVFVVTVISCIIGFEFERQRRKRFALNEHLQAAADKAEQAARTDYLTGLFNRKALFEFGHLLLSQSKRYQHTCCVIYLDLDNFKSINDTFGHSAGDLVIKRAAELCVNITRDCDAVGRIGGEEFVLVLSNANAQAAESFVQRLFDNVRGEGVEYNKEVIRFTFSAGISEFRATDKGFECALARADEGLYEAKRKGRDRWVTR